MIDWYMLLAPLLALPIVLLFAFVGTPCIAEGTKPDDPEFLFDPEGTIELEYTIPKRNPTLKGIKCTFETPGQLPFSPPNQDFTWSGSTEHNTMGPEDFFWKGLLDWTCTVELIPDVGPKPPPIIKTVPKLKGSIKFVLKYEAFPSPDYEWVQFNLTGGQKD